MHLTHYFRLVLATASSLCLKPPVIGEPGSSGYFRGIAASAFSIALGPSPMISSKISMTRDDLRPDALRMAAYSGAQESNPGSLASLAASLSPMGSRSPREVVMMHEPLVDTANSVNRSNRYDS
jgi:hypothetical protein